MAAEEPRSFAKGSAEAYGLDFMGISFFTFGVCVHVCVFSRVWCIYKCVYRGVRVNVEAGSQPGLLSLEKCLLYLLRCLSLGPGVL